RIQLYLFLLGYHGAYWVSAAATALGALSLAISVSVPDLGSVVTLSWILGSVSTLAGVVLFSKESMSIRRARTDLYEGRQPITPEDISSRLRLPDTYSEYATLSFRGQTAMYSTTVNALLREHPIQYRLDSRRFRLKSEVRSIAPIALTRAFEAPARIFNSPKV